MQKCIAAVAVSVCLIAPPVAAQVFSWDPLKDVQEAPPKGGQGAQFSGAAAVSPGVYLYQLTQNGLAATLTVGGTKFFKDGDLN